MTLPSSPQTADGASTELPAAESPSATPTAFEPCWAVRLQLTGQNGRTRSVTRMSDAVDLPDAVRLVLDRAAGEFPEDTVTEVDAFEPKVITDQVQIPGPPHPFAALFAQRGRG